MPVPVKKSPAKKLPSKKSPAKKSPVKKSPVKKSPVKKSPVKKSPVKPVKEMTVLQKVKSKLTKTNAKKAAGVAGLIAALGGGALAYRNRAMINNKIDNKSMAVGRYLGFGKRKQNSEGEHELNSEVGEFNPDFMTYKNY